MPDDALAAEPIANKDPYSREYWEEVALFVTGLSHLHDIIVPFFTNRRCGKRIDEAVSSASVSGAAKYFFPND
ncbi:hypothetical protein [Cohnella massiliensis]|uniref:hypothetical protein n=1 Tax=Cohnella massiliensis TaxID=1816691 RepID=UPI001592EDEB|nr:hypothetical protein [Cohnella massiliensis]